MGRQCERFRAGERCVLPTLSLVGATAGAAYHGEQARAGGAGGVDEHGDAVRVSQGVAELDGPRP